MLVNGVTVEFRVDDGLIRGSQAQVIDFDDVSANDFLAVNQVTVTENQNTRRADIVLFVNGLPLGVIELKNPADPDADIWDAWNQLQTYKDELPTLFTMNELLMISDGTYARVGTLTAGREWFKPWRTTTGDSLAETSTPELQVMLDGVCSPDRLAALLRDYIVLKTMEAGPRLRRWPAITSFTPCRWRCRRPCGLLNCNSPMGKSRMSRAVRSRGSVQVVSQVTGVLACSGTPRGRARV